MEATKLTRADLDQCRELAIQANRAYEEITEYRERAEQTTRAIDGMKVSGGGRHSDRVGDNVAAMVDKQAEYNHLIKAYFEKVAQVKKAFNTLVKPMERILLEMRYVDGLSWEQIPAQLGISQSASYRIHKEALDNFFRRE